MPHHLPLIALAFALCAPVYAQDDELAGLEKTAAALPKETKAGQMVADLSLARSMLDYGRRTKNPEMMLLATEILHKTPVETVKGDTDGDDELSEIVLEAVKMRPEDESLLQLAERVQETLEEKTRGLAGGPKRWIVEIEPKGYYQLDPRLVYNAQEKAIISARSKDPSVTLGASVRRGDARNLIARGVGKGRVQVQWNSGITTTGWDVRIYNLSSKAPMSVEVTTN